MKTLLLIATVLFSSLSFAEISHPKTVSELKVTSVRIMNLEMNSGGTGSIFRSYPNATHILTNKHICRLIEPGGVIDYQGKQYLITHYKKFKNHDLCLVRIAENLGVNLEIADELAKDSSPSIVSGHPSLLPHIVTYGHLSERKDLELVTGIKACTVDDLKQIPEICAYFGGKPVIEVMDAQLTSNLIKPGNSGSGVFNPDGKLIGVVFAGDSRDFSFGYIVPQIYLLYFTQNAHRFNWVQVGTEVDSGGMSDRVFDYKKCQDILYRPEGFKEVKDFCKTITDNMVWSK